jgi:hypothetical protein
MALQVGVINIIHGEVSAIRADGTSHSLQVGDSVYFQDCISTGSHAAIEISFADGSLMDLGRDSQVMLSSEFFYPKATNVEATDDLWVAVANANFLIDGEGDDILSGHHQTSDTHFADSQSAISSFPDDNAGELSLTDVLSQGHNHIAGVEHEGYLQVQVSNQHGVIECINLTSVAAVNDAAAQSALDVLLNPGPGEDSY